MIYYNILTKTNHWPRRVKKIDNVINKILIHRKDLKFVSSINYFCNFISPMTNFGLYKYFIFVYCSIHQLIIDLIILH